MSDRGFALLLIAIGLFAYGIYRAAYIPAMVIADPTPLLLLILFVLQAACALVGAVGAWQRLPWASGVIMLLGISIAVTELVEAFILGIVAYLYALLIAALGIVVTFVIAAYVSRSGSWRGMSPSRLSPA